VRTRASARTPGGELKQIRVDSEKLDSLIDQVGELVVAGAGIAQLAQEKEDPELNEAVSVVSRLISDIRENALSTRMVSIGGIFLQMRRLVRDLSHETGKDVHFSFQGGDTELDKTLAEKIAEPLTHLMRNAIDHGIEPPDRRAELGKPERGVLKLDAYYQAGGVVVEIQDDGRGLDRDRILQSALRKGLAEENREYSDREIFNFIFEPGFSTASRVTDISGRGVGLDVVRKTIENLRGQVYATSVPGQGCRFTLRLPLTLAIINGFLVKSRGSIFALPLDMVLECADLTRKNDCFGDRGIMNLRGEPLPYLDLGNLFFPDKAPPAPAAPPRTAEQVERLGSVVVVESGLNRGGTLVEELLGESQIVMKPMPRVFKKLPGMNGMTILGNGEIAMILDAPALLQLAIDREAKRARSEV